MRTSIASLAICVAVLPATGFAAGGPEGSCKWDDETKYQAIASITERIESDGRFEGWVFNLPVNIELYYYVKAKDECGIPVFPKNRNSVFITVIYDYNTGHFRNIEINNITE